MSRITVNPEVSQERWTTAVAAIVLALLMVTSLAGVAIAAGLLRS